MKKIYANRQNDSNILCKKFKMINSNDDYFKGKITLIQLERVNEKFIAKRPTGEIEVVIDNDYKILTFFPENESYCFSAMYNNDCKLLQWYFDILRKECKYDEEIPYGEDMYLDIVVLPNGKSYILDENELKDALDRKIITEKEFENAYASIHKIKEMLKMNFDKLQEFTEKSFEILIKQL